MNIYETVVDPIAAFVYCNRGSMLKYSTKIL